MADNEIANLFGAGPAPDMAKDIAAAAAEGAAQQAAQPPEPDAGQPPEPQKPQSMVPVAALDEARGETRDLRDKVNKMNQLFAQTVAMMQQQQRPAPQQPAPPTIPDPEREPIKHMQERFSRLENALAHVLAGAGQQSQQQQITQAFQADEMQFRAQHQDYDTALNFVRTRRLGELTDVMGYAPQQALAMLNQEEVAIGWNALQQGKSPAAVAYDLAKRWGYAGAQPAGGQQGQANAEKIRQAAAGIEAAKSLGQMSGQGGSAEMTLEALADLNGEVLAKRFHEMMGGGKVGSELSQIFGR